MSAGALYARALAPIAAALVIMLLLSPLLFPSPAVGDNFQFWAAGRMIVSGESPYDRASWVEAAAYGPVPGGVAANTVPTNLAITHQVWLYPPQTAFLFAPFGALPLDVGIPLLHLFVAIVTFAGVLTVAWLAGLRGTRLAFALTLAVVSQPFVIATRNGHPIGLLLIGGALLLTGVRARRDIPVAIGIALLTLKPQVALPIILFAFGYVLVRRDVRRLVVMSASAFVVTALPWLVTPFPLAAVADSSAERLNVDLSSIPALARDLGGGDVLAALLIAIAALACAAAIALRRSDRAVTIAAALFVLSIALVPYVHDYDMLLVIPGAIAVLTYANGRHEGRFAALTAVALVLAPWLLFYWWPLLGEPARRFQGGPLGAVPLVIALSLAAGAFLSRDALLTGRAPRNAPQPPERSVA